MQRQYYEVRCAGCHTRLAVSTTQLEAIGSKIFDCSRCGYTNTLTTKSAFKPISKSEVEKISRRRSPQKTRKTAIVESSAKIRSLIDSNPVTPSIPSGPILGTVGSVVYVALILCVALFVVWGIHKIVHTHEQNVERVAIYIEAFGAAVLFGEVLLNSVREFSEWIFDFGKRLRSSRFGNDFKSSLHHDFASQLRSLSLPILFFVVASILALSIFTKIVGSPSATAGESMHSMNCPEDWTKQSIFLLGQLQPLVEQGQPR
jgi:hypothetical protein